MTGYAMGKGPPTGNVAAISDYKAEQASADASDELSNYDGSRAIKLIAIVIGVMGVLFGAAYMYAQSAAPKVASRTQFNISDSQQLRESLANPAVSVTAPRKLADLKIPGLGQDTNSIRAGASTSQVPQGGINNGSPKTTRQSISRDSGGAQSQELIVKSVNELRRTLVQLTSAIDRLVTENRVAGSNNDYLNKTIGELRLVSTDLQKLKLDQTKFSGRSAPEKKENAKASLEAVHQYYVAGVANEVVWIGKRNDKDFFGSSPLC